MVRRLRELILISQDIANRADLCRKVGINDSNLYKYETGQNIPPLALLLDIAKLLGVTLDQLYPTELTTQEPTHAGWRKFRASEIGQTLTDEELADLAAVRFRNRVPTAEFYQLLLIGHRSQTQSLGEENTGVHDMRIVASRA